MKRNYTFVSIIASIQIALSMYYKIINIKSNNCSDQYFFLRVHNYDAIWSDLRTFSQPWRAVLLPSVYTLAPGVSEAIYTSVPHEKRMYKPSPIINMKAKKNPTEIKGMRNAHIRDGAAMCDVLAYLEDQVSNFLPSYFNVGRRLPLFPFLPILSNYR